MQGSPENLPQLDRHDSSAAGRKERKENKERNFKKKGAPALLYNKRKDENAVKEIHKEREGWQIKQ
jgi:hypothetical protein